MSTITQEDRQNILSLSYGKDSMACIEAIKQLGWSLDRIVHMEIWATNDIPADLPPMIEFKAKADKIIKDRYGIEVEHIRSKKTYEDVFYRVRTKSRTGKDGQLYGWPMINGGWCAGELKQRPLYNATKGYDVYLGIAADEPERIKKNQKPHIKLPLVEIGWDEAYCRQWCEANDLLSPIYTISMRGGCWFCHNQTLNQLRHLYHNYPEYWQIMLRWDSDSPKTFNPHGHTIHDYDKRFKLEDKDIVPKTKKFRWKMLNSEGLN